MVGAEAGNKLVDRNAELLLRRPFLKSGLGMDRGALLAFEEWRPMSADEGLGMVQPGIEEDRSEHRLDHIADHIVAQLGMIFARLLAEADVARQVERAADLGAGLAGHQRIVAAAHLAFGLAGEALVQPVWRRPVRARGRRGTRAARRCRGRGCRGSARARTAWLLWARGRALR